jgi:hypothetical protein
MRRVELGKELDQVATENVRLRLQKERLIQEVQLHENDPMSLERLAREKYWMIGPEERIYRFPDDEVVPDVPLVGSPLLPTPEAPKKIDEDTETATP